MAHAHIGLSEQWRAYTGKKERVDLVSCEVKFRICFVVLYFLLVFGKCWTMAKMIQFLLEMWIILRLVKAFSSFFNNSYKPTNFKHLKVSSIYYEAISKIRKLSLRNTNLTITFFSVYFDIFVPTLFPFLPSYFLSLSLTLITFA